MGIVGGASQPTLVSGRRNQFVEERRAAYERLLFIALFVWPPFGVLDVLGARLWHHEQSVPGLITLRIIGAVLLAVAYGAVRFGGLGSAALTILDVSHIAGVAIGDLVTLAGSEGGKEITVEELAQHYRTISYEVLCGITKRVPRRYSGEAR